MILKSFIRYDNDSNTVEVTWENEDSSTYCRAYHVTQFDELRNALGIDLAEYEAHLSLIESEYVPPAPEPVKVPRTVTMRQARLALLGLGLLDDVDSAIASLPSPQKEAAKIEWEYSQEVQRHNGFVAQLSPVLGLDNTQLDQLFITASKL